MAKVTGRELLGLKIGDVIMLDQKINDAIPICVGDILKFKGHSGALNNQKAIRIENRVNVE